MNGRVVVAVVRDDWGMEVGTGGKGECLWSRLI